MRDHHVELPAGRVFSHVQWDVRRGEQLEEGRAIGSAVDEGGGSVLLHAPATGRAWWLCRERQPTQRRYVAVVRQCDHPESFNGLCVDCGEAIADSEASSRVTAGSTTQLQLSAAAAGDAGRAKHAQLRRDRKLSLVLDLDHTLLHCTDDPRGAALLQGVTSGFSFTLPAVVHQRAKMRRGGKAVTSSHVVQVPYHCKLRPHVRKFLKACAKRFELAVYTHGERKYAEAVLAHLDPDGSLFSGREERVMTRSDQESGNKSKDLQRLFPGGGRMVLVADDSGHVWPPDVNLLIVRPYHYFQGMADTNVLDAKGRAVRGARMHGGSGAPAAAAGSGEQGAAAAETEEAAAQRRLAEAQQRDAMDTQLPELQRALEAIHESYFRRVDAAGSEADREELSVTDDVRAVQTRVLAGCRVVFSGIMPRRQPNPEHHRVWRRAEALGAYVQNEVDDSTTHVVAANLGTEKAAAARRARGAVAVVGTSWIDLSYVSMERQPERLHMLRGPDEVAPVKEAVDARIQANIAARDSIPDADVDAAFDEVFNEEGDSSSDGSSDDG